MKKIGILFGMENSFPQAFVDRVNSKNIDGVEAEFVSIDKVVQGKATEYAVIIDRISQDVPFYRAFLKNAAISGTAVINNPFWWSADEKFFNNAVAMSVGVPVPNTVLLPSKERPDDTSEQSFRNLKFPMDWDGMFDYTGFPVYMKPHAGGGWKSVYRIENLDDLWAAQDETGQLVMMAQEEVKFDAYFRCYCIGRKYVKIMHYEPRNPHHLRYQADFNVSDEMMATIHDYVLRLNNALGYDFNTVEFAIRDGIPYAIDFCNPAPDAELTSVGEENFEWVVEHAAQYAIECALNQDPTKTNLTWGSFIQNSVTDFNNAAAPVASTPAGELAGKIIAGISEKLEGELAEELADLNEDEIAAINQEEVIQDLIEEAIEEIIEEIEELFEEEEEEESEEVEAESETDTVANSEEATKVSLFEAIGTATAEDKEDLKKIKGVGPKLEGVLNQIGIYTFAQVSKMTDREYDMVDSLLSAFKGRGKRDDWAGQAKELSK